MCPNQILRVINITFIAIVPFGAVWFARHMQTKYNRHRDKLDVFKTLMSNKNNSLRENNIALALSINTIPVAFSHNRAILKKQRELMQIWKENGISANLLETVFVDLLRLIADDLGYKKSLTDNDLSLCIHPSDFDYKKEHF